MSSNNVIFINDRTYCVYYQDNIDEETKGKLVKKCKSLREAVEVAKKLYEKYWGIEYNVIFIGARDDKKK